MNHRLLYFGRATNIQILSSVIQITRSLGTITIPEQGDRRIISPGADIYIYQKRQQIHVYSLYKQSTKPKCLFTTILGSIIYCRPSFNQFGIINNATNLIPTYINQVTHIKEAHSKGSWQRSMVKAQDKGP